MIKVENVEVWGFDHAVRGARNPKNSWERSDSYRGEGGTFHLGAKDLELLRRLCSAGPEHRKCLRQIFVSMDVVAPIYWWKEADQYKVGMVTDSCSTMHTLTQNPITLSNFSFDNYELMGEYKDDFSNVVDACENLRRAYLAADDGERYWRWLIQLLPESFNQRRTMTLNYEVAVNMIRQRSHHRLQEWHDFCAELRKLPGLTEIMGG